VRGDAGPSPYRVLWSVRWGHGELNQRILTTQALKVIKKLFL
jgi:hypothetical protein